MSFPRKEIPAVMPRSIIDSNDSLFNPKKVFTIIDAIDHPPSSYTSSRGSDFNREYSYDQDLDICFKKPHPMSSTTNTSSSVDVDEEDEDETSSLYTEEEPDQLFSLPPIRDEWRTLFDMFDPEGFGEIPLDDFEVALDSREFITNISPGKIIILKDRLMAHRQIGVSAVTFQEFVNTLSGKRTLSFKCAMHAKDKQVSQPGDFHLRREDSIFSISDRLTEVVANETLTHDLDRKWFLNTHSNQCCCLWPPPLLLPCISIAQIVFYIYNSVAEHPLVLHPLRLHEPWRYITYFLVHIDLFSLVVNLFVQLLVGIPLEVVHGSFRVALIYGCGVLYGSMAASLFDPYVRLAGASGAAYALLSAHLANIILHHHSMSRPFLRLTGLLLVASLEIGCGIYRRYAPPEPEKPQVSFAAHLAGVVSGITFGLVILRNYEQKLSERRAWWITIFLLLGVSTIAFLYQRLRKHPTFTLFCTGYDCPPP